MEVAGIAAPEGLLGRHDDLLRAGDLLISRATTTELVGAVVYVERDYPNLMLADKTLRLVPISDVSAKYLLYALRTSLARDFFAKSATGTSDSMRNISQEKIRETPIPLPPLTEQRRIVERVEALLAQARTAREALAPLPALLRRLRQTVLAAAFSGRLSEREPGDEPAGELLERIRAERALLGGRRGREQARALPEGLPGRTFRYWLSNGPRTAKRPAPGTHAGKESTIQVGQNLLVLWNGHGQNLDHPVVKLQKPTAMVGHREVLLFGPVGHHTDRAGSRARRKGPACCAPTARPSGRITVASH